ncbi:hypothetical protein K474DRAFT_779870 [Panus rudis PR-1116 ss-1]|nr:hypothetical protein K474DRAFT_779870 [Panus rudis PR-1116 ss-1]
MSIFRRRPGSIECIRMAPRWARPRRSAIRGHFHPFLFTLMALTAAAELGLTAFLISAGHDVYTWTSPGYHSLLILLCFEAAWTLVFSTAYMLWVVDGAVHLLANVASSVFWLLLTAVLWGIAAGLFHSSRADSDCVDNVSIPRLVPARPPSHPELRDLTGGRCRQTLTVEALGWTEFSLCATTLVLTMLWVRAGKNMYLRDSRTLV